MAVADAWRVKHSMHACAHVVHVYSVTHMHAHATQLAYARALTSMHTECWACALTIDTHMLGSRACMARLHGVEQKP
jgi:hypothetical protein